MSSRRYSQLCSIARALDVIGDRWTLLIVRELLLGPRRYTDLTDGLPGIATDMLASRLRDLEHAGVVTRGVLPPPAASRIYRLTERGAALEPVLESLAGWGRDLLAEQHANDLFLVHWLVFPLRTSYRPDRAADIALIIRFDVDGQSLHVRVDHGELVFPQDAPAAVDLVIAADAQALGDVFADAAAVTRVVSTGRLSLTGTGKAIRQFRAAFGFDARRGGEDRTTRARQTGATPR